MFTIDETLKLRLAMFAVSVLQLLPELPYSVDQFRIDSAVGLYRMTRESIVHKDCAAA